MDFSLRVSLGRALRRTRDARGVGLEVRPYGGKKGSCPVYEDGTVSFGFSNGQRRWRSFFMTGAGLNEVGLGESKIKLFGDWLLCRMTE